MILLLNKATANRYKWGRTLHETANTPNEIV